tara:strand:- start:566 stop:778 length:213 start_codon:yes stop_codon:yes gene_type:complete
MVILRKMVTYTDYRWEETTELTSEQIKKWKSGDEDLQEEVLEEVEFDLVKDKVLEDHEWPELIEDSLVEK